MKTRALAPLLLLLALLLAALPAHARRIALVIGNDNYVHTDKLANARNDANAMATALGRVGFTVTRHLDVGREALFQAVDAFVMSVRKDDEVVVFYSGHGVQIDSAPYLLPTDIKADNSRQIQRDALALDMLVGDLAKARYTLVIVDACRNNPFAVRGQRAIGSERGLAPIEPPEGAAIIMSAGRGQTALDSLGPNDKESNGLFTRELLRLMETPGLQVRDLLLQVRDTVEQKAASVQHRQRPALVDESRGQFFFKPPVAAAPATTAAAAMPSGVATPSATATPVAPAMALAGPPPRPREAAERSQAALLASARQGDRAAMARLGILYAEGGGGLPRDALRAENWLRAAMEREEPSLLPWLQAGAAQGQPLAMALLAVAHSGRWYGLSDDPAQVRAWYQKAADAGDGLGMNGLGSLAAAGRGAPRDDALAERWYRKGAEAGHPLAMANLGLWYEAGRGGLPRDEAQAAAWYARAAALDTRHGPYRLALLHELGRAGAARNDALAVAWFRRGAELGDSQSMQALGFMTEQGRGGLTRDESAALALYRSAADLRNGVAMYRLGMLYLRGRAGLTRSDSQAVSWFRRGAEAGSFSAMFELGAAYLLGRGGLPVDETQAAGWLRKAADGGNLTALANLGVMHLGGRGGLPQDEARALSMLRRAADGGDSVGMNGLGMMYRDGLGGLPKDLAEARRWFQQSADLGFETARTNLARLP